jgi:ElaB/YqjD/DUF883 family membrane-anchored ribosome-binding protein
MSKEKSSSRDRLEKDMKAVISDTQQLLKATAGQAGGDIQSAREQIERTFNSAKTSLEEFEREGMDKVKEVAGAADRFVRENQWPSLGIAAGIGLIFGWLLSRRK